MGTQTPEINTDIRHAAAGNLAFLLSVIRCGEPLSTDEEANVRSLIGRLETASRNNDSSEARNAALEEAAQLHEQVNTADDFQRLEKLPGAGAMGAIVEYRDKIRALKSDGSR